MAVGIRSSSTAVSAPTLPAGSVSGDMIVVFAYNADRNSLAALPAPTLPASWTNITDVSVGTTAALRVAYRIYDGVWSMPTWTNATTAHAVSLTSALAIGTAVNQNGTSTAITWAAFDTQVDNATSMVLRGAVHDRPDSVPPLPASHTDIQRAGIEPGYITVGRQVADPASATSTVTRASAWLSAQVEIRETALTNDGKHTTALSQMTAIAGGNRG